LFSTRHIGGSSQKGLNLKKAVRSEFIKNRALVDPKLIEDRKLKYVGLSLYNVAARIFFSTYFSCSAFRFLTNFLLIESNKRIEQVDKSKILFNVGEREQTETEQIEKRQALKAKVLADAEEDDEAPRK
jgi:hypothetical protein